MRFPRPLPFEFPARRAILWRGGVGPVSASATYGHAALLLLLRYALSVL
jgi:hypothetical protein